MVIMMMMMINIMMMVLVVEVGWYLTLIECLLFADSCSEHFMHRNLFNPHGHPMRQV